MKSVCKVDTDDDYDDNQIHHYHGARINIFGNDTFSERVATCVNMI